MDLAHCIAIIETTNSPWICRFFAASGPRIFQFLSSKNLQP